MKALLATSPHLDHSYRAAASKSGNGPHRLAQSFVPMGLLSLASAVEPADVEIWDINKAINSGLLRMSSDFYDEAASWLLSGSPDIIGFMTEADSYHHLLQIFRRVKERRSSVATLLGGVQATALHRETIEAFQCVDLIVRGEGEVAFKQLVDALANAAPLSSVCNLTFRVKNGVHSTSQAPLIEDLDTLPFPKFAKVEIAPEDAIYVEIGRGCPFKCNFCFTAPYWQRRHRIKSPTRIIQELSQLRREYGRTDFNFTHDLFTTDRKWVIAFCRKLVHEGIAVTWTCSSRTDTLDEEQLYWMQRAGCRDIYFGVETGTPEMQRRISKDLDLDQARKIIAKTVEAGVGATVGFIAGLPGESSRTLQGTLTEAVHYLGLPNSVVHLFGFCPYRGSPHFGSIADSLEFGDEFVDFPLPKRTHTENCALMREHFAMFSRYGRLAFDELDDDLIQAASEYFPILNAIKGMFVHVMQAHHIDQLDLLRAWATWIGRANLARGIEASGRFLGTIAEFLSFLESYCRERGHDGDAIMEAIDWERQKNALRAIVHEERRGEATGETMKLIANPSLRTRKYQFAPVVLAQQQPGVYAFCVRRDGTPSIVRLGEVAAAIVQLVQEGADFEQVVDCLEAIAPGPAELRDHVGAVVESLVEAGIILT